MLEASLIITSFTLNFHFVAFFQASSSTLPFFHLFYRRALFSSLIFSVLIFLFFSFYILYLNRSSSYFIHSPFLLLFYFIIEPCHRQRLYCPIVILCCPSLPSTEFHCRLRRPCRLVVVLGQDCALPLIDLNFEVAVSCCHLL